MFPTGYFLKLSISQNMCAPCLLIQFYSSLVQSSIRLKAICNIIVKQILGTPYDVCPQYVFLCDYLLFCSFQEAPLQKHLASAQLEPSEIRSALAVLRFILVWHCICCSCLSLLLRRLMLLDLNVQKTFF